MKLSLLVGTSPGPDLLPFLNMGVALACFQPVGTCLRWILILKIKLNMALKCNHKCPTEVRSQYCQVQVIYSISVLADDSD